MISKAIAAILLAASSVASFAPVMTHSPHSATALVAGTSTQFCREVDYVQDMEALDELLQATRMNLGMIKDLAEQLKELELQDPSLSDLGSSPDAEALRKAVAEAKAACDVYGPESKEARLTWEEVDAAADHHAKREESHSSYRYSAAALKAHHDYNAVVDAQLLADAMEAVDKIEALALFVEVEKKRLKENMNDVSQALMDF